MAIRMSGSDRVFLAFVYVFLTIVMVICVYPLALTVVTSFSNEKLLAEYGFRLIPMEWSLDTYDWLFSNGFDWVTTGYRVSISQTFIGTFLSMAVMSMYAFVTSAKNFRHRFKLSLFCYFTMVFQAGVMPWYLYCTRYYHLNNSIWGLILPYLVSPFMIVLLRTFYLGVPDEIQEAATIDGANPFQIFWRVMLPLAKPGVATVTMYVALMYWNDMYLALYLMTKDIYYPLQYRLYSILSNVQFLASAQSAGIGDRVQLPTETVKMALTCVTIGPIIFLYPFVQNFFVKGIMSGAVKG